jgi:hypothetical protein
MSSTKYIQITDGKIQQPFNVLEHAQISVTDEKEKTKICGKEEFDYLKNAGGCTLVLLIPIVICLVVGINKVNEYNWESIPCKVLSVNYHDFCYNNNDQRKCYELYLGVEYKNPITKANSTNNKVCPNIQCYLRTLADFISFKDTYKVNQDITCQYDLNGGSMKLDKGDSDFPEAEKWVITIASIFILLTWCYPCINACD